MSSYRELAFNTLLVITSYDSRLCKYTRCSSLQKYTSDDLTNLACKCKLLIKPYASLQLLPRKSPRDLPNPPRRLTLRTENYVSVQRLRIQRPLPRNGEANRETVRKTRLCRRRVRVVSAYRAHLQSRARRGNDLPVLGDVRANALCPVRADKVEPDDRVLAEAGMTPVPRVQ